MAKKKSTKIMTTVAVPLAMVNALKAANPNLPASGILAELGEGYLAGQSVIRPRNLAVQQDAVVDYAEDKYEVVEDSTPTDPPEKSAFDFNICGGAYYG